MKKACQRGITIAVGATICAMVGSATAQLTPPRTQVVLLGTGTPGFNPDRSGPATAIVVNGKAYLIDAGPGVVRRAEAAKRKGIAALSPLLIRHAFFTHLHSDHTLGYPDLIFTPGVIGRKEPLQVFGPIGIKAMTGHLMAAWREDLKIREEGLERHFPEHSPNGYKVNVTEISSGVVFRDENVTVTAFPVKHGEWKPRQAFGYRFQTADRTIVISGDASPSETIVEQCNGCDVLIHEVYTEKGYADAPPEWQRYRRAYHTASWQLADLATRASPKLLILYHQMYHRTSTEEDLIREMRERYKGQFVSGHDLEVH